MNVQQTVDCFLCDWTCLCLQILTPLIRGTFISGLLRPFSTPLVFKVELQLIQTFFNSQSFLLRCKPFVTKSQWLLKRLLSPQIFYWKCEMHAQTSLQISQGFGKINFFRLLRVVFSKKKFPNLKMSLSKISVLLPHPPQT